MVWFIFGRIIFFWLKNDIIIELIKLILNQFATRVHKKHNLNCSSFISDCAFLVLVLILTISSFVLLVPGHSNKTHGLEKPEYNFFFLSFFYIPKTKNKNQLQIYTYFLLMNLELFYYLLLLFDLFVFLDFMFAINLGSSRNKNQRN